MEFIFTKNRLEGIRLISVAHVWLYGGGVKIVCSFVEIKVIVICTWYMHLKGGREDCHANLNFSFLIIYIIVPFYRRKFCDGHIILVLESNTFDFLKNTSKKSAFMPLLIYCTEIVYTRFIHDFQCTYWAVLYKFVF